MSNYYCPLCDEDFISKSAFNRHLYKNINQGDLKHKELLINTTYDEILELNEPFAKKIKLIDVFRSKGRPYMQWESLECHHICVSRVDPTLTRSCTKKGCIANKWNHPMSQSQKDRISKALTGKLDTPEARKNKSLAQNRPEVKLNNSLKGKEAWTRQDVVQRHKEGTYKSRFKHAQGIAISQRNKQNKDELLFKQLLEDNLIKFIWQYPYVDDNMETIFDFYLPEYNMYIYLDGSIHDNMNCLYEYDNNQLDYFKDLNMNVIRLSIDDAKKFIFNLERE